MIDYLLKFDSKDQAVTFAEQMGFTTEVEEEDIEITVPLPQSEDHVYTVIGEHFVDTGKTETIRDETGMEWEQPIMKGDGKHWVLFRDIKGDMDAEPAEEFIVWSSAMTEPSEENEGEEVPVPRPENAPDRIFL
tara:strand:- start:1536 stop:1937 length:402 start_codon:yes stop_codon:yes gene_type:complete